MHNQQVSKSDLHIHSKHSNRPSEWFLRKIGAPESFVEPLALYENCMQRGMDYVTISDHNTIHGALDIAHLPNTFISCEVTTYFPEDGCKIHCLVTGITEKWFEDIDVLRENIYDFRDYLVAHNIIYSVAHPLFRINDKLTIDHFEKLLLLFNRFEGINGSRCHRACQLANTVMAALTSEMIEQMADRHGIAPLGDTPWQKMLTAGSDDHSGLYACNAYTETPHAKTVFDFLEHLRAGRHQPAGGGGTSLRLAHSFYHIAYSYYASRFLVGTSRDSSLIGAMLRKMAGEKEAPKATGMSNFFKRPLARIATGLRKRQLSEVERLIVDEFAALTETQNTSGSAAVDEQNFHTAARISHQLTYSFMREFVSQLKKGNLLESLQSFSSLGPVVMGIAPYLTSFHTQHKDERFLRDLAQHYPASRGQRRKSGKIAWITDTLSEVNGVARTISCMSELAHARQVDLTVLTSMEKAPVANFPLKNFTPLGTMGVPEYEGQPVVFPPFLEVLEYIEKQAFDTLVISTPGPMGLVALWAGKLFGLEVKGIYHTDFPGYIRHFTEDYVLEDLTRKFMAWFYGDMQTVYVSSESYRSQLTDWGIPAARLRHLPHGVDTQRFNPSRRNPGFWQTIGVNGGFKYLYVGRVSKEKNLESLLTAFTQLTADGVEDAELIIVGQGPHEMELARRFNQPNIIFAGVLEGDDLAQAFAGADVFVFPSMTDTFGNAVLEAQASGLPAIVAEQGGPAEIVRRLDSGLVVDARYPENLTDAMLKLKVDPELRARLSGQALAMVGTNSWEDAVDHFLADQRD